MSETNFPEFKNSESYFSLYNWDIELLSAKDKNIKVLPRQIESINKNLEYHNSFLPVILLRLKVFKEDLFKLKDNDKDIIASITIKCKKYIREENGVRLIETQLISSGTFSTIFSPSSFKGFLRREEYENGSKYDKDKFSTNQYESDLSTITIGLNDIIGIKTSKQIFNECFDGKSNPTVGTLLNYLISNVPVKGCIVDKPTNENSYTQDIILPPLNFVSATRYLQNVIGCYEHGMLTFYDDDVLYILNKFADNHDVKKNETNLVHLYIFESDKNIGSIVNTKNKKGESVYVGNISFIPNQSQIMKSELYGDNFIFSSFRQGLDAIQFENKKITGSKPVSMVMKHNTESHSQSGLKNVLDYDELNNPFNMASQFNAIESMAETAILDIDNVDINDFRPNKFIQLHFKDSRKDFDYGGKYYILQVNEVYNKSNMQPDHTEIESSKKENKHLEPLMCSVSIAISRRKRV